MNNFELSLPLINGDLLDIYCGDTSGIDVVNELITDDFGAQPRSMNITVTLESGRKAIIIVPYDRGSDAVVMVDNEQLK